ncbi:TIGR02530 family flagellar biosynthesis protein [Caloramator quimbayensis]|uniref:TIGR02530 family flagellar biosynthesis protein n=1 Tax=Caloramator quimbayensis TaxID=1147123 RepID=UPI001FA88FBC|nr:TIGR02530 family flagellar biosynthesis protein [Caloramator quimbayensis]
MNEVLINRIEKDINFKNYEIDKKINRAVEFSKVLERVTKNNDLKISAHAAERLKERSINLTEKDIKNLMDAMDKIKNKGGREALILYNDLAFITSVRNNTIITAVDSKSLKDNVFTNIDSAIII